MTKWGIKGALQLYADDTNIFYHKRNLAELESEMNTDLSQLTSWLRINKLTLNVKKTHYILFGNKKNLSLNVKIGDNCLEKKMSTRYLGLIIDSQLSWNLHINHVKEKITPITGVLYRLQGLLPTSLLTSVYYAMVHSHLSYLCCIWGFASKKLMADLQVIQNRALRNVLGLPWDTHVRDIYLDSGILPIKILPKHEIVSTILHITHQLSHTNIKPLYNQEIHQHNTRSNNKIRLPLTNTTKYGIKSLEYTGYTLYNSLPDVYVSSQPHERTNRNSLKEYFLKLFINENN